MRAFTRSTRYESISRALDGRRYPFGPAAGGRGRTLVSMLADDRVANPFIMYAKASLDSSLGSSFVSAVGKVIRSEINESNGVVSYKCKTRSFWTYRFYGIKKNMASLQSICQGYPEKKTKC
ncbi:hypothetical protein EVAR_84111_1 [Eumeta japonica]|uniref:Uncharacterized protein n=1 Tax=Eumeta variegata TaxID=151549 RepID=A0A4C1UYY0_EUMVA|nr:hypothetical protein EVAR_84111_1 [Eumeta japonica]